MHVIETNIKGLLVFEPKKFSDHRGFFMETWNENRYAELGIPKKFYQDNISCSNKGVLRGLHFQWPQPQGKLVSVLRGSVLDVAVDLRKSSPTYKKWFAVELSETNNKQMYLPEGFAHGFLSLANETIFSYKCTDYYNPKTEKTLLWNDPAIGINWDYYGEIFFSEKDLAGKNLIDFSSEEMPC